MNDDTTIDGGVQMVVLPGMILLVSLRASTDIARLFSTKQSK